MQERHILFATTGSLGDLHPFLATGAALRQRGHRVTVATTQRHQAAVEQAGLAFRLMRPNPPDGPEFGQRFMDPRHGAAFAFREYLSPAIRESYDDLRDAATEADLLVSQSLALAAPLVAEATGIPWLSAVFQPMTLFSADDPPHLPPVPFSRRWPKFNHWLIQQMKKHTHSWTKDVRELRAALGLAGGGDPVYEGQHAPAGVLAMFSPLLGAPQPDWPVQTIQTGAALYQPPESAWPPHVRRFLDSGPAPIIFTLGSASSQNVGDFYEVSLQAARRLGQRALIVTGAEHPLLAAPVQGDALAIRYCPFHQIFPRGAAIVHAGGIAATCHAIMAWRPQLIVPFAHDQHDNAARARRLGVASVMARRRYRPRAVAHALKHLLRTRDEVRLARLATTLGSEDGATRAADVIEQHLRLHKERQHG
jgi:UDP:flavonoid glycosyltransferase YjiC (YdhE family)